MVVRDRLAEMQQARGYHGNTGSSNAVVHTNTNLDNDEEEEFFNEIESIKKSVDSLSERIQELRMKHNALINPTISTNEEALRNQVDDKNAEITKLAGQTNMKLKKLKNSLDEAKRNVTDDKKAFFRARQTHYNALTRKFKTVMEDYNATQMNYKDRLKTRLKKQLQIVDRSDKYNDDQLDEMIEKGDLSVFDEGFIQMKQNRQVLDELEVRKNEMLALEQSITELHALFVEMAALVDEQGEMVDRILDNVQNTEAYVEKAVEDVHQAARYQSSARRKKVWLFIFCIIALLVVALILWLSLR